MRISKAASWTFFCACMALLLFVVWSTFVNSDREGVWETRLAGRPVGDLAVIGMTGEPAQIEHPAVLYFFRRDCRFCAPAARRLHTFLGGGAPDALAVFAITNEWDLPESYVAGAFRPDVRVLRLSSTAPGPGFIEYLPLFIRTDTAGLIAAAYIGVPKPHVLQTILAPQGAGPGGKP